MHLNEKGANSMRKTLTLVIVLLAIALLAAQPAMAKGPFGSGKSFFYNHFYQWLRDDDGDGIPNCQDPDYTKPEDGTGYGTNGDGEGKEVKNKYQNGYSYGDEAGFLYRFRNVLGECKGKTKRGR
jgi:hypothetical protein